MIEEILKKMEPYKTIHRQIEGISGGEFLKISQETFTLQNGETLKRNALVKRNTDAVVIIPETKDYRFLMVIQPRPFTKRGVTIEFPAGYVEQKETLEESAKRELEEETGYRISDMKEIAKYYQDISCSRSVIHIFHAKDAEKVTEQHLDDSEMITFMEVTQEELFELYQQGLIVDANTAFAIQYLLTLLK